jgi:hypothetical protein
MATPIADAGAVFAGPDRYRHSAQSGEWTCGQLDVDVAST